MQVGGALLDLLQDDNDGIIQFEFVKCIGQSVCPLNLFGDKEPTAAILTGMSRQGPVYVRARKKLKVWLTMKKVILMMMVLRMVTLARKGINLLIMQGAKVHVH